MAWWWPFGSVARPGLTGRAGGTGSRAEGAENAEKRKKKKNFFAFLRGLCALCAKPSPPLSPTKLLGNRGEAAACRCLKKAGMKILARNYRCPGGEIDIIALDPSTRRTTQAETIVFVEVKTRAAETPAGPASAIDAHKRKQVVQAARYYLRHHPAKGYLTRYDAVAVIIPPGQEPTVRHIPNAF
jgi:putative endonuclease